MNFKITLLLDRFCIQAIYKIYSIYTYIYILYICAIHSGLNLGKAKKSKFFEIFRKEQPRIGAF